LASNATLFALVPIGEENAVPASLIWEAQDRLWTTGTLKTKLNNMVKAGEIEKKYTQSSTASVVSVYFRKAGKS
jgi:hypothetical protein